MHAESSFHRVPAPFMFSINLLVSETIGHRIYLEPARNYIGLEHVMWMLVKTPFAMSLQRNNAIAVKGMQLAFAFDKG